MSIDQTFEFIFRVVPRETSEHTILTQKRNVDREDGFRRSVETKVNSLFDLQNVTSSVDSDLTETAQTDH